MKQFLFQLALALTPGEDPNTQIDIPTVTADAVLKNGLNTAYFIAGVICVIVIIVSGIMYSTSGGDAAAVTKAKNQILFAIVGIVIILSAFAVTNFVIGRF